ncbi:MAG: radical SAM protein, partial [Candidatus Margulisiibacteriota bacterium]
PQPAEQLADIMLSLQSQGCHNINLVTPTHFMPQILQELKIAFEKGLEIPIIYNTNGYDSLELLKILDGIIDVYMPDFKYFDDEKAKEYSNAGNYIETAKAGIKEMLRQVGNMRFDENDVAVRGLIVRHLVLPNGISDSKKLIKYLSAVSKDMWISIMSQYSPQNRAGEYKELERSLPPEEYWDAVRCAQELKMENYLIQEMDSKDTYAPDFKKTKPFG